MKHVFIVEDERALLRELTETFPWEKEGCLVIGSAGTFEAAREFLQTTPVDILVTDIRLPDGSGFDLITAAEIPSSIVITGYHEITYAQQALRNGVVDFLLKPLDDTELRDAIRRAVERCSRTPTVPSLGTAPDVTGRVKNPLVLAALAFIRDHYQSAVSLSEAAAYMKITEGHLASVFKAETGCTFVQALTAHRMEVAARLLQDYRHNVAEVAELCGYGDPAYFSKVFRRHHHISPRSYRTRG